VKFGVILLAAITAACGARQGEKLATLPLENACAEGSRYNGSRCVTPGEARQKVEEARSALAAFDVDKALPLLETAIQSGPHDHALLVDLHEQRGIAYSYLKRENDALSAFASLLALDPGHLLSYTLSPQATFLYERARKANANQPRAQINLSWPQNLRENQPLPVAVEVISDPNSMLERLALYLRHSKDDSYRRVGLTLPKPGQLQKVHLPAPNTDRPTTVQLFGRAYDSKGDEVLLWFDPQRPREIPLAYEPPTPWYRKWWVWAAAGGVVAAATGTTVYLLGLEPSDLVGGGFELGR
jgi:tetratricopeptide (TPR) repeat protein